MANSDYNGKWEGYWGPGLKAGEFWDCGRSSPALVKLLSTGEVHVAGKTCLVPGCGRGYDVVEFAKQGASKVIGLELSPTAAQVATNYVANSGVAQGAAKIVQGDWLSEADCPEQFDVGYDYTFFCALHPSMRADWAKGWHRRLKPEGHLITLMFPLGGDPSREGPPWPVSVEQYEDVLAPLGFTCLVQMDVPPEDSAREDRIGKEVMAVWRKMED